MKFSELSVKDKEEYIFKLAGIYFQKSIDEIERLGISKDTVCSVHIKLLREMCDFLNARI